MALKQSIVVVSEFTNKGGVSKGSRGNTPGEYVTRYMGRDKATEDLTPVRLEDTESYITRYMARKTAAETLGSVPDIKKSMRASQKNAGVAFGYGSISLSDKALKEASKDIQRNYDNGKTVMKTVLSFDEDYLRKYGIVNPDFVFRKKGDYRGNLDQMKLRMAIMNGMRRMGRAYDDLQYVGVIQVDTKHVHCHLAMVDRGRGTLAPDGTQKGKISAASKRQLRYGIDSFLEQQQKVHMMTSNIGHDKRNAVCFIKKFTHQMMDEQGVPQFLIATLPVDKRLWRADTNRKEMRKPNQIVRDYVNEILQEPGSGYGETVRGIERYASRRARNEGLGLRGYRELVREGQERVVRDCMNGVYSVLKQVPPRQMSVKTPMLSMMAMDYDDLASQAASDPMMEFGFKLRSYSSRLQHHKKEMHKWRNAKEDYDSSANASVDSKPMRDFFAYEEEYNAKLMCKYQHLLKFLPPSDDYEDEFEQLIAYRKRQQKLRQMYEDKSIRRMRADTAEEYGRKVYGMHGGRYVATSPSTIERRLELMEERYGTMEKVFKDRLADDGLTFDGHGVSKQKPYAFDEVKALDIHHLGYDWSHDLMVSKRNIDAFCEATDERARLFEAAKVYLVGSGQEDAVSALPERDITAMRETADRMRGSPVLQSVRPAEQGTKRMRRTVRLDVDYDRLLKDAVKQTVQAVSLTMEE